MRCLRPTKFNNDNVHVACGQCMPCRINKRTEWKTKLMLEWQTFPQGVFTTLTYKNEDLPNRNEYKGGSLNKKDLQDFLKRFRINYKNKYGYTKVRYFGVGEYGERFKRAHYHVLLFNVDPVHAEDIIKKSWKKGITQTDLLNENRIKYTIGYTIKKQTNEKDFPDGRYPEFNIMSKNPGLGWYALPKFAEKLKKRNIYPSRSINQHHEWILEQKGLSLKTWNGVYKQGKQYYRFDKNCMIKLAKLTDSSILETLEKEETVLYPKEFKIKKTRLHDNSYLDTIKFVTSEEADETKKQSEKKQREEQNSKKHRF